jgi:hypothetical protein
LLAKHSLMAKSPYGTAYLCCWAFSFSLTLPLAL